MNKLEVAKQERLDVPRDIAEIAKIAGWTTGVAREKLMQLDKHVGGTLLTQVNRKYYCSLAQLRRHWPDVGKKIASEGDLNVVEKDIVQLKHDVREQGIEMRVLRKHMRELTARLDAKIGPVYPTY